MILETLAGIHEGFRNAQLISPDQDLPKSFRDLQPEELNTVARIFEVTSWLQDFCEAAEEDHDDDHISPYRTICIRCIESADEAAVGMMRRLEHSQKEIVLKERGKLLAWNTVRKR